MRSTHRSSPRGLSERALQGGISPWDFGRGNCGSPRPPGAPLLPLPEQSHRSRHQSPRSPVPGAATASAGSPEPWLPRRQRPREQAALVPGTQQSSVELPERRRRGDGSSCSQETSRPTASAVSACSHLWAPGKNTAAERLLGQAHGQRGLGEGHGTIKHSVWGCEGERKAW